MDRRRGDVYDLRKIRPRQGLTLRFDRATHALEAIRYEIDDRSLLVAERTPTASRPRARGLPYFTEVKGSPGRSSAACARTRARRRAGPHRLRARRHLRLGARPRERPPAGRRVPRPLREHLAGRHAAPQAGKVLARRDRRRRAEAAPRSSSRTRTAAAATTARRRAVSREFLRYPVEFTEITSRVLARPPPSDPAASRRPHWASTSPRRTARRCAPSRAARSSVGLGEPAREDGPDRARERRSRRRTATSRASRRRSAGGDASSAAR